MSIRTAIIGYGTGGRVFHAPLVDATDDLEVAAIVTANSDRAQDARQRYPKAAIHPDTESLFADADFDLLVVTSPNATHAPLAQRAIHAGIPVVLDKPLATSVEEARAVVEAAEAASVPLTVFQNRRWDGDFLTLRDAIDAGDLGDIHQFDSAFEWWAPTLGDRWKDTATVAEGGGILLDLGPHLIDQALVLFGDVADVHAELDARRGGAANDDAFVTLTHTSGVRSRLWMSAVAPANRPRFRAVGSEAVFEAHGLDPQEPQSISGMRPGDPGFGLHEDGRTASIRRPDGETARALRAGRHLEFYETLVGALVHDGALPVDPRANLRVLEIIEQAQRS